MTEHKRGATSVRASELSRQSANPIIPQGHPDAYETTLDLDCREGVAAASLRSAISQKSTPRKRQAIAELLQLLHWGLPI